MAESWQSYKGGILQSCGSGGGHCIQAVGYDTSGSIPYWIVRNSWGSDFGVDGGYIHIEMFKELCGIGTHGAFSTTAGDLHVNATRYHCNKVSRTCMPSVEGHSSAEKCAAACGAPSA